MADDVNVACGSSDIKCNYCGSKTSKKFVKCSKCGAVYHSSCAGRVKGCSRDTTNENMIICCGLAQERDCDPLLNEVTLLRKLVHELEEKNTLLMEKILHLEAI